MEANRGGAQRSLPHSTENRAAVAWEGMDAISRRTPVTVSNELLNARYRSANTSASALSWTHAEVVVTA